MEREEKMMWAGTIVLIVMLILFIISIYLLLTINKEGAKCLINPLAYNQKANPKAFCSCWQAGK